MDAARLLAEDETRWLSFAGAVAEVGPARRDEPTLSGEGWSVATAVFHVAYWLEDCARVLEAIGAGTWDRAAEPEQTRQFIEQVNAGHAARAAALTATEIELHLAAARDRARRALLALTSVTAEAWGWFEESGPLHYPKHEADIRRWLAGASFPGSPEPRR